MRSLKLPAAFLLGVVSAYVLQQVTFSLDQNPDTAVATLQSAAPESSAPVSRQACMNPKHMYGHCVDQLEDQICTICSQQLSE